ncbi:hypothetical protein EC973_003235 [Apophysomyces ossiformis]|uniref:RBR-type E3 ubiquitin transferase n=1 Tax=Apophysomyces ossiformis TaxID=679940 RepID=A0A8H7BZM9_9FUNG|nr:hypothetical protein EC973_003235 [Apophysomyces ossiformis]
MTLDNMAMTVMNRIRSSTIPVNSVIRLRSLTYALFYATLLRKDNELDDMSFEDEYVATTSKKTYEVEYIVRKPGDLFQMQDKEIDQISSILTLPKAATRSLLQYFCWNQETLLERYMESPNDTLQLAGVKLNQDILSFMRAVDLPDSSFMCMICCSDGPEMETVSLSCDHRFCKDCYQQYVSQKICMEGETRRIECPQDKCNVVVDSKLVRLLMDNKTFLKFEALLNHSYVNDKRYLRWCPAPDCENAIECHIPHNVFTSVVPTVRCLCGYSFCFGCGSADHQPIVCFLVKKWLQKCKEDSETAHWISVHTKECPSCQASIEKNGGCNHMTCKKCREEFCWVCMGLWSKHVTTSYNCNRFDKDVKTEGRRQSSRLSLERYLHYYSRFSNHEQSARLDQDLYLSIEKKMETLQQTSSLSWIEVQFLKHAVDVAVLCRTTLKWTYAFAFYLYKTNETAIFEDNQRDLELATEQLSELLQEPLEVQKIAELRQAVLDKTVYVKHRREVLLEDAAKGLVDGRWTLLADLK